MNKIKLQLLIWSILIAISSNAQEEFYGNNQGVSLYGGTCINDYFTGGLSIYFNSGIILSESYQEISGHPYRGLGISYLFNNNNNNNSNLKGLIGISYSAFERISNEEGLMSLNAGLYNLLFKESNFPSSVGANFIIALENESFRIDQMHLGIVFSYKQSFFVNNRVYPIIGISYSLPIKYIYNNLFFNVGLNIKL
jgi:hypothetical protein